MRLLSLLFLLLSTTSQAQTIIPLYPEGIPCANELEDIEDYRKSIGRGLTSVHTPLLHHYKPQPMVATGASIMIIPGGGYMFNAWDHEGVDIGRYFVAEGINVFILQYRLPYYETGECKSRVALDDGGGNGLLRRWTFIGFGRYSFC